MAHGRGSVLALLAAVFGGCLADDASPAQQDEATLEPGPATPGVPPSGLPAAPRFEARLLQWAGHTKEGVRVCSNQDGIGQCPAGQQVLPDGAHVGAFAYDGNLTDIDLNMTWAAEPTQAGLVLAAYANTTDGRTYLGHARGQSPLRLEVGSDTLLDIVPDDVLVLIVWPEGKSATEPSLFVDATQQDFDVSGTVMVRVAAPSA